MSSATGVTAPPAPPRPPRSAPVPARSGRSTAPAPARGRGRTWRAAAVPALGLLAVQQALVSRPFIDDSYTFYRYASNWAHGLGLVFNPGQRVEGFSSFLWTAVLSLGARVGLAPPASAPVLGVALAAGCLVLVAGIATERLELPTWLGVVSALAVAASPAFAMYASSGMDTILFALVLLAAVAATARHVDAVSAGTASRSATATMSVLLVALVLVRAEGPVYALALGLVAVLLARPDRRDRAGMARLAPLVAAGSATALIVAVRAAVYATWIPATVMAKGYTSHVLGEALGNPGRWSEVWQAITWGLGYVGVLPFALLALTLLGIVVQTVRVRRLPAFAVLGGLALWIGIVTATWDTGDWMPYRRLLVPLLPLMVLLGSWSVLTLSRAAGAGRRRAGWRLSLPSAVAALCAAGVAVLAGGVSAGPVSSQYEAQQLRSLGRLAAGAGRPVKVLTNLAGILPYYAGPDVYVWDMLGLNDAHNAGQGYIFSPRFGRTDPRYDFSRRFDLFVSNSPWDLALLTESLPGPGARWLLYSTPRWQAIPLYVVARTPSPVTGRLRRLCGCRPLPLSAGARRALLAQLLARGAVPAGLPAAVRAGRPFPA